MVEESIRQKLIFPAFPGCVTAAPERFQMLFVAKGVHGLPEARMVEGHQLAIGGEAGQRRAFPACGIALDAVQALW